MENSDDMAALRAENARLIALLEAHGIAWSQGQAATGLPPSSTSSAISPEEKIALFRRLFRGRADVFPIRWESKGTGKSGYSPACANEWRAGICEKPRIRCNECAHRQFVPLTDTVVYDHLTGKRTLGVYPLLEDDCCYFLAADFDDTGWREDAIAFASSCEQLGVPVALEISRSGQGAHAWIFFADKVAGREARRLGTAIISHASSRTRQFKLTSYDRLFPNQDTLPKGGFGNLIALPLQKVPREFARSVFVDAEMRPYPDQWSFLASARTMPIDAIDKVVTAATGGSHPLDVTFIDDEDMAEPWMPRAAHASKLLGSLPERVTVTFANQLYLEKTQLPQPLANRLIRLAAFQNPEFYRAQAMRLSVWDKPRVIGCAENYPRHISLPRSCLDAMTNLLRENGIRVELTDERFSGIPIDVQFIGTLRPQQASAVAAMLEHDFGILCAPTAFGKTVAAAALIARRPVNTLVLVHRTELLKQWQERLKSFLAAPASTVGIIGGGKSRPSGLVDIAVMQSLVRKSEVNALVEGYGQVLVDECHHIGASSFDAILRRVKARYVIGLTATPIRRDGLDPIIFMQCGPIRHRVVHAAGMLHTMEALPRILPGPINLPESAAIQEVFRHLAHDHERTGAIAAEIKALLAQGRKLLVLTERTDHLESIHHALNGLRLSPFVLHGRMSSRQRATLICELDALPPESARVVLATGKLVGEGFDHPPLDTLMLAMPISWKGTLQQYAGRLHREHTGKLEVRIIDFVDTGHPALLRMWEKRRRGYKAMGYRIFGEA